jgi:uncharacterized protein (UPF0303 family)
MLKILNRKGKLLKKHTKSSYQYLNKRQQESTTFEKKPWYVEITYQTIRTCFIIKVHHNLKTEVPCTSVFKSNKKPNETIAKLKKTNLMS